MVTVYGLPLNAPAATSGDAGNGYNMVLGCTQEGRRIVSANLSRTTKSPPRNRGGLFVVHGRKSECASFSRCVDGQTEGDRHHSQGFMSFECLNDPAGHWSCRSEEHTSELQSLMRISYAVFCLKKKNTIQNQMHSQNADRTNDM